MAHLLMLITHTQLQTEYLRTTDSPFVQQTDKRVCVFSRSRAESLLRQTTFALEFAAYTNRERRPLSPRLIKRLLALIRATSDSLTTESQWEKCSSKVEFIKINILHNTTVKISLTNKVFRIFISG